jgi:hypothetical protein
MVDDVDVKFGGTTDGLKQATHEAKDRIESVKESVDKVTESAKRLLEAFGIAFTVDKTLEFIDKMAELGETTERTMAILGITAAQVGEFGFMAKATGSSLEGMTLSLERMTLNIQRSQTDAFNPAALALQKLGLSARELQNMPLADQFYTIASAASKFNADISLSNALMALGGRGMTNLIPIIAQGEEGLKKLAEIARDSGVALSGPMAAGFAETHLKIETMSASIQGLGIRIFSVLKPAIDKAVTSITAWVRSIDASTIVNAVQVITGAIATALSAVGEFAIQIMSLLDQADQKTSKFAGRASAAAGGALAGTAGGAWFGGVGAVPGAAIGGLAGWFGSQYLEGDEAAAKGNAQIEARRKQLQDLITSFRNTMAGLTSGLSGGAPGGHGDDNHGDGEKKPSLGALGVGGKDALAGQMKEIEGQIAILRSGLEQAKLIYEADAQNFKTTQDKKFGLVQQATNNEYLQELALLQKELGLHGLNLQQRQEINNKIAQLQSKNVIDMLRLNQQSVQSMKAQWQDLFTSISGAWNSNWRGLLTGTTTLTQALKNTFLDLTIKTIEYFEKMGIEWLATQLGMTTATQTAAAARTAAEAAGRQTGAAASYAESVATVLRNSVLVFGGVFANLAPFMGPLAAGPAAAAQGSVAATVGELPPPLATGTMNVPQDMQATLHRGEIVVPATFSDGIRSMLGGGGKPSDASGTHVHLGPIQTMDAQSFKTWIMNNKNQVRQILGSLGRDGHLAPA